MKDKTIRTLLLTTSACLALSGWSATLDRSRFNIGVYYLNHPAQTEQHVRDLKACSVDFVIGCSVLKDRPVLDLFEKYGMQSFSCGVVPWGLHRDSPLSIYDEAVAKYRGSEAVHPATTGVTVFDEPSTTNMPLVGAACARIKALLPECFVYMCLLPIYGFDTKEIDATQPGCHGAAEYERHIDAYCRHVPLDYLCYDFYLYPVGGCYRPQWKRFYENFRIATDACRRTARSFWMVGQVNSMDPKFHVSENNLRFQAYSAMAYGVETMIWACYSPGWWTNNVLTATGEKTEQYEKLRKVNGEVRRVSDAYMRFRNVSTSLVGDPAEWGDVAGKQPVVAAAGNGVLGQIRAADGGRLAVGLMAPRQAGLDAAAALVCASDDPWDEKPVERTVSFVVGRGYEARVIGGSGPVALRKTVGTADGWSFPLKSSDGALIVVRRKQGD